MRNFVYLLTLVVFLISAPLAMAAQDTPAGAKAAGAADKPSVNCCVKGQCKQVGSEMDCAKDGGKIIKECKECK
jgi:hypothetical protein